MAERVQAPVAFLIFNRPALTEKVFAVLAQVKPQRLLVVADGPRTTEEKELCSAARSIIKKIDWDCRVQTNFADTNLGCGKRISTGLDWVFSEVEEAIIVEDDCLPHPSFFKYCDELLERYRDDERIMHIGGANFQRGNNQTPYSYYFSRITHSWGWATWRRAWRLNDFSMATWPDNREAVGNFFDDQVEREHFLKIFEEVYRGQVDTWDYQWCYSCLINSGLAIIPNTNMVANIGWGEDSTHNKQDDHIAAFVPTADIGSLNHPPSCLVHRAADRYTLDYVWGGAEMRAAAAVDTSESVRGKPRNRLLATIANRFARTRDSN